MTTIVETLYLFVEQVAKRFGVSKDSIWRWTRNGGFPKPLKLGGSTTRWRLSDIEEWERHRPCSMITELTFAPDRFLAG